MALESGADLLGLENLDQKLWVALSCPACGAAVDVPGLIVEARGPEALEACYDQPEMSEEQAADLNLHCTHCGYPLKGLPAESTCPECGRPFDKRASTSRW